jgi:hypothetical protein
MADIQEQLAEFEKLLNVKQKELLKKQNDILTFVDTKHRARATKKYQQEVRALAKEINDFVILLVETKEKADGQKDQAEKLCGAGMGLNGLAKDLGQALASDLAERQHDETVDVVKIAGVVGGLAAAAVTVSRYSFDPHSSHVVVEASVGASFGLTAAMWKPICKGFVWTGKKICAAPRKIKNGSKMALDALKRTGKEICSVPKNVKNSFALYYMREAAKETAQRLLKPLGNQKSYVLSAANDDQLDTERGNVKKKGSSPTALKP